jgi:hypothetical protein
MRLVALLVAATLLAACASSPQPAAPAASPVAVVPPAPAVASSQPAAASAAAAPAVTASTSGFKAPPGYRAVTKGNQTVYCTTIRPIGSNLTKSVCLTESQLEEVERRTDASRRDLEKGQKSCGTPGGGCGG